MKDSITYVGMDVHKNTYSVCCYNLNDDEIKFKSKFTATTKNILKYLQKARDLYPKDTKFICGYEAGYSGYAIYRELEKYAIECKVLAPSTITNLKNRRVKTDARDCENIARSMALNTASEVFILDEKDENVREYLRMRDDHKNMFKRNKQQILFLLHRQNMKYTGGPKYWTAQHILWLNSLKFEDKITQETFDEYMTTYYYLDDKIKRFDKRIEEISQDKRYKERSEKLQCFLGVKTHTAMSCLVEIGDFNRFRKPNNFAAFLGFIPSEYSSGDKTRKGAITKSGNQNLRKLLTEAAQCYTKGKVGYKSKCIIARQSKCTPDVIAYADKANERLRRRFYTLTLTKGMNHNKAKTAIARELSCFI